MGNPIILPSFAAGELAPSMYGRVDLAKYHVGAALLRNYFVDYRGGASSRTGTKFVGQCKDSTKPNRLIPFQFNSKQTYQLVFGDLSLRFVTNGGYVLEPTKAITGISKANPGVVTDTAHGYSNGDLIILAGIVGMTQLNQRFGLVTAATTNTYTLTDMFGVPIDTTGYGAYVSGGTSARVYTLITPYAAADLALLKFTQSADVMTITHTSYAPYTLERVLDYQWTLTAISFVPSAPAPLAVSANNNGVGTTYPSTQYSYQVTAIVGGVESLPSAVASVICDALGQNVGAQNVVAWAGVTGASLYNIYRTQENLGSNVPDGALFGYIGAVTPGVANTFIDDNILPDFTNCPPQGYDPFTKAGNPGCVTYYQQRQVFGGMANAPEQIDMSKTGDFFNMGFSIPSKDDDNIEITIASQQVNAIEHMIPMQSLIVLTANGAWAVSGGTVGAAITPEQVQALPQAYNGCSSLCPPIPINYDILYVQARGSIVRDLAYNFYVNLYTGTDITMLSNHLFSGHQILEWCYAEEPYKLVWCVREDGILLSLTYLKEQDVNAWARHDTQGLFKSISSVVEGDENVVYAIVERFINGQYLQYIERFASREMGGDTTLGIPADVTRAWCVDAGLQYPVTFPTANLTPTESTNTPVIAGVAVISGGSGYSPSTTVSAVDSTGSNAILVPVIVAGVIESVTVLNSGTAYTNPVLNIFDPLGTGSGAVLQSIVQSPVVMNASAAVFSSANVGDVVRINGGMGIVTSAPSTTQIIVNVINPLNSVWPAASGEWSMTTPVSTVSGLDHLDGETVAILADGNVQPNQVVVNGSVTLDQLCTAITVGLPYICQLKSLYIDIEGGPTIQSKRKTIPAVSVRMQDSRGLAAGRSFAQLTEFKERTTEKMGAPIPLFTGDERIVLPAAYDVPGQICIQQSNPLPSTILALIPEVVVGDT
jgi:hypothetical protein